MFDAILIINNNNRGNLKKELKEKILKQYCQDNIIGDLHTEFIGNIPPFDLLDKITDLVFIEGIKADRILIINTNEIAKNDNDLFAIKTILDSLEIEIESISEGIIGKDMTFQLNKNIDSEEI